MVVPFLERFVLKRNIIWFYTLQYSGEADEEKNEDRIIFSSNNRFNVVDFHDLHQPAKVYGKPLSCKS